MIGYETPQCHSIDPAAVANVEKYDGKADVDAWLFNLKELARMCRWTEETTLSIARIRCSGPAQLWAQTRRFTDWDDFERQFLRRFGQSQELALLNLENCYQREGETAKSFADRFLAEAGRAGRLDDPALLHMFTRRLTPELACEVSRKRPGSLEEAMDFCAYWAGMTDSVGDLSYVPPSFKPSPPDSQPQFRPDNGYSSAPPPFAKSAPNRPYGNTSWPPAAGRQSDRRPPDNRQAAGCRPPEPRAQIRESDNIRELTSKLRDLQINLQQERQTNHQHQERLNRLEAALRRPRHAAEPLSLLD